MQHVACTCWLDRTSTQVTWVQILYAEPDGHCQAFQQAKVQTGVPYAETLYFDGAAEVDMLQARTCTHTACPDGSVLPGHR